MLTDLQKSRLVGAIRDIRDSPGWRFIRQLATAEASYPEPSFEELKKYLVGEFSKLIDEEIANGIARQKGSQRQPAYPGRTTL